MHEGEFDLIARLFKGQGGSAKAFTRLGIGDDASIHSPTPGMQLVVSTDTSVQGVHWPEDFPLPQAADRAVCSALSDLAAMGAEPVCVWLNVMADSAESLEAMGEGAVAALRRYDVELAGGDTCRSKTNTVSLTVAGQLPEGSAMRRDAARAGDGVWICGHLGFHALGLQQWMNGEKGGEFVACFESITPRLEEGVRLRELGIKSCIDISDGLVQDAGHLAQASAVGIEIEATSLPAWADLSDRVGEQAALQAMAYGGEDYALLFTAPAELAIPDELAMRIGSCVVGSGVAGTGVRLLLDGLQVNMDKTGFDHFG